MSRRTCSKRFPQLRRVGNSLLAMGISGYGEKLPLSSLLWTEGRQPQPRTTWPVPVLFQGFGPNSQGWVERRPPKDTSKPYPWKLIWKQGP